MTHVYLSLEIYFHIFMYLIANFGTESMIRIINFPQTHWLLLVLFQMLPVVFWSSVFFFQKKNLDDHSIFILSLPFNTLKSASSLMRR